MAIGLVALLDRVATGLAALVDRVATGLAALVDRVATGLAALVDRTATGLVALVDRVALVVGWFPALGCNKVQRGLSQLLPSGQSVRRFAG